MFQTSTKLVSSIGIFHVSLGLLDSWPQIFARNSQMKVLGRNPCSIGMIIKLFQLILQIYDPGRCQMLIGSRLHPHTVVSAIKASRVFSCGRREARTGAGLIPRDKHFNYNLATYLRVVISSHSLNVAAVAHMRASCYSITFTQQNSIQKMWSLRKSYLPKISL